MLERAQQWAERRRRNAAFYREALKGLPGTEVPHNRDWECTVYDALVVHVEHVNPVRRGQRRRVRVVGRDDELPHGPRLRHAVHEHVADERAIEVVLRLIDEQPRTGIRGSQVAFLHPASTGGVLTEIVQPAKGH